MSDTPQVEPYEILGKYYRTNWERYSKGYLRFISRYCALPQNSRVVDLGCGTGHLSSDLADLGFSVFGVDSSPLMISQAMANCKNKSDAEFKCADMQDVEFPHPADLVIIAYDAINYLLTEQQVFNCLENACVQMNPGASIVFDVNTPEIYRRYHGVEEVYNVGAGRILQRTRFEPMKGLGITQFIFELPGEGSSETHVQKVYSIRKIKRLLSRSGFSRIHVYENFDGIKAGLFSQKPIFHAVNL